MCAICDVVPLLDRSLILFASKQRIRVFHLNSAERILFSLTLVIFYLSIETLYLRWVHVEVGIVSVPGGDIGHRALVFKLALLCDSIRPQLLDDLLMVCVRLNLASLHEEANSSSVFLLTAKVH